ncbi:hypothetical protein D3C79_721820 [compost metagenome]
MRLELQHIVGQVGDIAQITEDIVNAIFQELGGDSLIALGQWLEGIGVEDIVEAEDRPVDRLPGIILGGSLGSRHRCQQQAGTDTGLGDSLDHTGTDPTHRCFSIEFLGRWRNACAAGKAAV